MEGNRNKGVIEWISEQENEEKKIKMYTTMQDSYAHQKQYIITI